MDNFEEAYFHAMGLLLHKDDNVTQFILLRNFTTRKELHDRYINDCENKSKNTDWGKEASPGHDVEYLPKKVTEEEAKIVEKYVNA